MYGNIELRTGILGFEAEILGVPIGGSYDFGSGSTQIEISGSISNNWTPDLKITHKQTVTESGGNSLQLGTIGGATSSEKTTVRTLSLQDGTSTEISPIFQRKESGSIGPVRGNNEGEFSVEPNIGVNVDLLLLGVGVHVGGRTIER